MKKRLVLTATTIGAMALTASASTTADTLNLQEVTVTAIKQGSDIRNLAISATEIRRNDLERNGITGTKSAADMVPNIYIPDYGSRMTSTIYVRGLGTRIDQPALGLNIDNVPVLCKENYDFDKMCIRDSGKGAGMACLRRRFRDTHRMRHGWLPLAGTSGLLEA